MHDDAVAHTKHLFSVIREPTIPSQPVTAVSAHEGPQSTELGACLGDELSVTSIMPASHASNAEASAPVNVLARGVDKLEVQCPLPVTKKLVSAPVVCRRRRRLNSSWSPPIAV